MVSVVVVVERVTFNALKLLVRHQEEHLACKKRRWWLGYCLEQGANDLHMV